MKTITKYLYEYDELPEGVKETAEQNFLHFYHTAEDYHEICLDYLKTNFPHSILDTAFQLCYCQGDGLVIKGCIDFSDVVNNFKSGELDNDFTKEELNILSEIFDSVEKYRMEESTYRNDFSSRKDCDMDTEKLYWFADDYGSGWILYDYMESNPEHITLIERFWTATFTALKDLEESFAMNGYDYLYNCDLDELRDIMSGNDYWFDEHGNIVTD